ncbi:terminase small subunit [Clostridium sp. Cult3]|uniref:terminase small subunit n=1 Tax=Clostridium sp. Cult3 TaxID=2079004 RepID=UPI001F1E3DA8|nr:terminase small subunit [Clostridium sp. Cult3]MCF6461482.1 terminase small subunit [Clostridium sp. Cult3]
MENKRKLTEKQKRFIDYYVELGNATEAAKRAGYSERSAKQIGNENLTKLDFFIKERLKELEDKRIAKADEVLKHLTAAMRGEIDEEVVVTENIGDFMSEARVVKKQISARERIRAAELLGRRYALFTDKVDMDIDAGTEKLDSILKQLKED